MKFGLGTLERFLSVIYTSFKNAFRNPKWNQSLRGLQYEERYSLLKSVWFRHCVFCWYFVQRAGESMYNMLLFRIVCCLMQIDFVLGKH